MTIRSKHQMRGKMQINLSGPEGNAFVLLGYARKLCKQLNKKFEPIMNEMTKGDYENLIKVFDREFGEYIDLYR